MGDILQVLLEQRNMKTVENVMSRSLVVTHPEEDLEAVLIKMLRNQIGRLPVVESENSRKLIGNNRS